MSSIIQKSIKSILLVLLTILWVHTFGIAEIAAVSDCTAEVRDAIIAAISGVNNANDVTDPSLPQNHYGYRISKSDNLPLEVIGEVVLTARVSGDTPGVPEDPPVVNPIDTAAPPIFTDGKFTIRVVAENTNADVDIGRPVAATDANNDDLTYTLGGTDSDSFDIETTTGQLKTEVPLDYEMKRVYGVTITASDGNLTNSITVIISVIDVEDTDSVSAFIPVSERTASVRDAIVAAVPDVTDAANVTDVHLAAITSLNLRSTGITSLYSGDFTGMNGLTNLNLYGNVLSSLPNNIFEGLTSLTSLRLGGNSVEPITLIVSLQQVSANQYQTVIPTGAPFDIVVPIDGASSTTMVTIPKGSVNSVSFTEMDGAIVNIGTLPSIPVNHFGYVLAKSTLCTRSTQVVEMITASVPGVTHCRNVSEIQLAGITSLNLSNKAITSLKSDDFSGMLSLTNLDLRNNQLSSLPEGIFKGLTSLNHLNLSGNSVSPLPLPVTLQKVGEKQIRAFVPTGAPFNITLQITVENGFIDADNITIPKGSVSSQYLPLIRTANTIEAVTVDIETVPSLPSMHSGYTLVKPEGFPLEIYSRINVVPIFTEGITATRTIAENTASGENIGEVIAATDANNDKLMYTLGGTDATSFDIDSNTGQLKTKTTLDYEEKKSYTVTITVSDGTLTDTIDITINVIDVDENSAPVFTEGNSTTRTTAENTASGENIGEPVDATDADDDPLTYSLGGTNANVFAIDTKSGQLKTSAALDYETKSTYSVTVSVYDGKITKTITVTINITDIDENPTTGDTVTTRETDSTPTNNPPEFIDGDNTTRSVDENTGSGVDIGAAVSATDADGHTLTYELGGTNASSFSINSRTGQLHTKDALDYEAKSSYSLIITVSDGNLTDTIDVTINIVDVDESPVNTAPEFTDGDGTTRSVAENTGSGVDIGPAVSATDVDNDTLAYGLIGTDATSFSIDSTNGQLRTSDDLDYETKPSYSVTITVSDGNGGSDSISVTIIITDVDESPTNNAPEFASDSTTRFVQENTDPDINIGAAITATDADDDTLTYTLSGTDASSFDIDSDTGQLKTSASLNFETKSLYSASVNVSDGSLMDSITVTINVTDVNEAPSFSDDTSTTRAIAENVGAEINIGSAVSATDPEGNTLTYTLGGADASSFGIDSKTGQLKTRATLDHEAKASYTVTITVSDGILTDTITVTINVTNLDERRTNNPPVFTEGTSTTRTIAENTDADENIGAPIAAKDADKNTLAYLLSGSDASSFAIDSTSGQLKTSAALNHETKAAYTVNVIVSDGSGRDTISVTINVTDVNEAPVIAANTQRTLSVLENAAAGVNIGGTLSVSDQDDGDILTFTLGGTDAATFDIVSTSGQLQTKAALDYETKKSYAVRITVSDGKLKDTIDITINVADVDENRSPAFSDGDSTTLEVAENTGSGVDIGTAVSATDADEDDLTYTLGGTDAASFSINSTNGQLRTKSPLDFETKSSYSVTISVSDGKRKDTITVTINVTDVDENRAPVFSDGDSTTLEVAENTSSGVDIGTAVSATDADEDDLTYTLGGTDAASFSINSTNGQLRTKSPLDFETKSSYSVTISVSDGKRKDTITVTINVTDVDENRAPVFSDGDSTTLEVAENTSSGVDIGTAVSATDADEDDLTYTLGGTDAASFSINSTNGQLRTKSPLDFETKSSYSVTVSVSDGKRKDTITVTINVTDVDENRAPVFSDGDSTTREVAENTDSGVDIGTAVSATDADEDDLTYTLGGTDAASFSINSTNGQLRTKSPLDFETKSSYSVTISVSDGKRKDTITVTINVTDVDENRAPVFSDGDSTTREVAENTDSGVDIGTAVSATDADMDDLTYTLGGTDAASFSINSTNGQLHTKTPLDYETKTSYSVIITVSDGKLTDTINVTINVTDVDENRPPVFAQDSLSRSILIESNTAVGDNIGTPVTATDPDEDDTLTYSVGGTDVTFISIVSTTGQLQTTAAFLSDTKITYAITVIADDGNGGTDSVDVTVRAAGRTLQQQTNSAPTFTEGHIATRSIEENTPSGVNIGNPVAATDTDNRDRLRYILDGADAASFGIVSTSGQLQTSAALDYETKNSYTVIVMVFDGKGGTDGITVTINVTDATIFPVSDRTSQVQDAIVAALSGIDSAADVTEAHLTTITSLNLSERGITSLKKGDFNGLSYVISIELDHNELTSLPGEVFDGLLSLTTLYLAYNEIASLSENVFVGLSSIESIGLDHNKIASLPENVFDGLSSLEDIDLRFNELTSLPENVFDGLSSLDGIFLSVNKIASLSEDVFDGLSSLEDLWLSKNQLSSLPENVFGGLSSLENLWMHRNSLTSLPEDVFDGLSSLEYIALHRNQLTSLPAGLLNGLSSLNILWLYANKLTSLPDGLFAGVPPMHILVVENYDESEEYMPFNISLEKIAEGQLKVKIPVGTPLNINLNLKVTNGSLSNGESSVYIPAGSVESETISVTRTADTTGAVTVDIGTLPRLPSIPNGIFSIGYHNGYAFAKSGRLPLEVIPAVGGAPTQVDIQMNSLPDTTALLTNYPNPFNPETWIPYQLAKPSDVSITIYSIRGTIVRHLDLGHQTPGYYTNRRLAGHWDGRNNLGERVANGVYYYHLQADIQSPLRKMVILK